MGCLLLSLFSLSPYMQKINRHGDVMCAFGSCRKHTRLAIHPTLKVLVCSKHQACESLSVVGEDQQQCAFERCHKKRNLVLHPLFNNVYVCSLHRSSQSLFREPETRLVNDDNQVLCHAFGCSKTSPLARIHGGLFCPQHGDKIRQIRRRIDHSHSKEELLARQEEVSFRKKHDLGHLYAVDMLTGLLVIQSNPVIQ